jgi:L-serine dehydratase
MIIMESIKKIFRIGNGPSSSHTMGPKRAAELFLERSPAAKSFKVTLFGALAATGRGHLTDKAIEGVLTTRGPVEIVWKPDIVHETHTNGMLFQGVLDNGETFDDWMVFSIGGGNLASDDMPTKTPRVDVYDMSHIADIQFWCEKRGSSFWEYVEACEGPEIWDYIAHVWEVMKASIARGLETEGTLPGGLGVRRKASDYLIRAKGYSSSMQSRGKVIAYALAVSEENAAGGEIVTAPTCGSSGILPAVLYHLMLSRDFRESRIMRAIATAGLFGNVVRTNASISGAEVGCQGEVGVACAMGAAAACQLFGGSPAQIEYAAEMALEHHLGLTCDPICGLVQIPCIERNAFGAARALDANTYATFSDGTHRVSFDRVVEVMRRTGHDIPSLYKETSEGGLAAK